MNASLAQMPQAQVPPPQTPPGMTQAHFDALETDGTVHFYQTVQACQLATGARDVLDFGAGRGRGILDAREAGNRYKAFLQDLRSLGAQVTACDIDDAVQTHPAADRITLIEGDKALPFADASFDLIVSDNTFEHIEQAETVACELLRVLRPGGFICARTPNKNGYVALAARFVPDGLYAFLLRKAQPRREDRDKFPVCYRLNDRKSLERHFAGGTVIIRYPHVEPSYFFGSKAVHAAMRLLHGITPAKLRPAMIVLVRKD